MFSGISGQAREQEGARQSVYGRADFLENGVVERRGQERGSVVTPTPSPSTRQHSQTPGYRADGVSVLQEKLMSLESLQSRSNMLSRSGDRQFQREQFEQEMLAAKLFPHAAVGRSRSVALENGTTFDTLSSGALEQLSKKTGERLLQTAIQSSFASRAMGMQGATAGPGQLKEIVASASRGDCELFAQLDTYGRSNCVSGQRASPLKFLVGNQEGQNESEQAVVGSTGSNARVKQDLNHRAFQMRDLPGPTFMKQQRSVQRLVLEECTEERSMVESEKGLSAEQELEMRQILMAGENGSEWQSEEHQGLSMDRPGRGRLLGGPEVELAAYPSLKSTKAENGSIVSSRLCKDQGALEDKEAERIDVQSHRLEGRVLCSSYRCRCGAFLRFQGVCTLLCA